MKRRFVSFLFCLGLCAISDNVPAGGVAPAGGGSLPDVQWALHVLYLPGNEDARPTMNAQEGPIAVRAPWECVYKRTTAEQYDLVKIKCMYAGGAVVGSVAMCRREPGQSDLAQISIGVDGVPAYETIDLSCFVPRDRGRGDESYRPKKVGLHQHNLRRREAEKPPRSAPARHASAPRCTQEGAR